MCIMRLNILFILALSFTTSHVILGQTNISEMICPGESYDFCGEILTSEGEYMCTLLNQEGEDSIVVLNLSVSILELANSVVMNDDNYSNGMISIQAEGEGLSYSWSNGANTPDLMGLDAGTYTLTITNSDGCTLEGSFTLETEDPYEIPNVFTPNHDDVNDFFKVYKKDHVSILSLTIYNRWGAVVYDDKQANEWNGNYKGEPAPVDVYIYSVELEIGEGNFVTEHGEVTLVR